MQPAQANKFRIFLAALLPALLIVGLTVYVLGLKPASEEHTVLPGRPLATYEDLYPIRPNDQGSLMMDPAIFAKAVEHFSESRDLRAIADLLYLGNMNNVAIMLDGAVRSKYAKLGEGQVFASLNESNRQRDQLLQPYADIVNGVGLTFAGTPIEIVLHDTRNPMKSIVALQNPISGRRLGDPNTNFGVQLIKTYSQASGPQSPFVSYGLTLKDGRAIKSSTVPLFNEKYGLIGFICINIDISKLNGKDPAAIEHFMENFRAITENEAISEMIQNSRRKN